MKKYQVTIHFELTEEFMMLVPEHRAYINELISKDFIDQYAVSMESMQVWITMNAESKDQITSLLKKSPLYKFWSMDIYELFVLDGMHYRLPAVQPN